MINIFLQFVIMQKIFSLHLMFLKGFKTNLRDTEKKMIEWKKVRNHIWFVM